MPKGAKKRQTEVGENSEDIDIENFKQYGVKIEDIESSTPEGNESSATFESLPYSFEKVGRYKKRKKEPKSNAITSENEIKSETDENEK